MRNRSKRSSIGTQKDEDAVAELAKTLGIAFFNRLKVSRRIPTKFDYLVAHNRITQADLEQAIREAQQGQLDVETVLLEQYQVPRADIGKSLSQFYRCPFLEDHGRTSLDPELLGSLNPETLRSNAWIPLKHDKDGVHILSDDPNNLNRIQEIKRAFPGRPIRFAVGLRADILQFDAVTGPADRTPGQASVADVPSRPADETAGLRRDRVPRLRTGRQRDDERNRPRAGNGNTDGADRAPDQAGGFEDTSEAGVARVADRIMRDACRVGASHVHIEPQGGQRACVIRFRVDGLCVEHATVPAADGLSLAARCKAAAGLDLAERNAPQEGRGTYVVDNQEVALRVATLPTAGPSEDVVMHLMPAMAPMVLDQLGLAERHLRAVHAIASNPPACSSAEARRAPAPPPRSARSSARSMWPSARSGASKTRSRRRTPVCDKSRSRRRVGAVAAHPRALRSARTYRGGPAEPRHLGCAPRGRARGHLEPRTPRTRGAVETGLAPARHRLNGFGVAHALVGVRPSGCAGASARNAARRTIPPRRSSRELAQVCGEAVLQKLGYAYTDGLVLVSRHGMRGLPGQRAPRPDRPARGFCPGPTGSSARS